MTQTDYALLRELTLRVNTYRAQYRQSGKSEVSDEIYDILFQDLVVLEEVLGVRMKSSPTRGLGKIRNIILCYDNDGSETKNEQPSQNGH